MKKIYLLAAVSVLTLGYAEVWAAQATGTGNISAKIVAPVTVTETQGLDFGTILAPTDSAKTVTISTGGSRSDGDSGILVKTNEGHAGLFDVKGADSQTMTITVPNTVTLTSTGGGSMTVNNFVTEPANKLTLSGTSGQIKVGADLAVSQGQAVGDYAGTYTVTVSY